jgi:large subunit ribosomal protein L10
VKWTWSARQQKEEALNVLQTNLKSAKATVFANFQGLKVKESEELRAICRKERIVYVASKKTLLARALKDAGFDTDADAFSGGVAAVFAQGDEVGAAKVIADFAKTHEVVTIFGGILEGKFIDANSVKALAKLPTRQQLLGQLVGTLNAPVSGFVNVLAGNLRGLVTVLNAVKDKQAA